MSIPPQNEHLIFNSLERLHVIVGELNQGVARLEERSEQRERDINDLKKTVYDIEKRMWQSMGVGATLLVVLQVLLNVFLKKI
jgi:ElaB/YqjD/DUF883 family membrane-anchored ribosome-binding protein